MEPEVQKGIFDDIDTKAVTVKRKRTDFISDHSKRAQALQQIRGNGHASALKLIERVRRLHAAEISINDIVTITGKSRSSIKKICACLNKTTLQSTELKELAVNAIKEGLQKGDDAHKLKLINKVLPDPVVQPEAPEKQGVNVNLNFNPKDLDFKNEDHDYIDMESY
jgi:hypothetical protein